MKNNFKNILIILISILVIPLFAKADMGAPEVTQYEVIVTNPEGTKLYNDWTKKEILTIPYDTKLTITFEFKYEGELYGYVDYNNKYGQIKLTDVKAFNSNIDFSKFSKTEIPTKKYIFREGAYLYEGPSKVYGKVDKEVMIPVGEVIEYTYFDDLWIYTEYNGVKGWLYDYPYSYDQDDYEICTSAYVDEGTVFTVENITELHEMPGSKETIKVNIPAGTEIDYKYRYTGLRERYLFVEYKGVTGWLHTRESYEFGDTEGATEKYDCAELLVKNSAGIKTYKSMKNFLSVTKTVIPYLAKVQVYYYLNYDGYLWSYVEYNGNNYWVIQDLEDYEYSEYDVNYGYYNEFSFNKDTTIYEDTKLTKSLKKSIPKNEKLRIKYTMYNGSKEYGYVEYDGVAGWVNLSDNASSEGFFTEECVVKKPERHEEEKENKKEKEKEESTTSSSIFDSITPMMLIIIGISGAVILALVAIVTIILVNKKKKRKQA